MAALKAITPILAKEKKTAGVKFEEDEKQNKKGSNDKRKEEVWPMD